MSTATEVFSPWSVVHLVFDHLTEHGLHPVLGETGDPSVPAAELLRSLGIEAGQPALGDGHLARAVREDLAALRSQYDPADGPEPEPEHGPAQQNDRET